MYGGHVVEDWDRRLTSAYLQTLFQEGLLEGQQLFPQFDFKAPQVNMNHKQVGIRCKIPRACLLPSLQSLLQRQVFEPLQKLASMPAIEGCLQHEPLAMTWLQSIKVSISTNKGGAFKHIKHTMHNLKTTKKACSRSSDADARLH